MSIARWAIPLSLVTVFVLVCGVPDYSGLPPGPYCTKDRCCGGRRDTCSVPIVGTLCYCDDFCNRTRSEDCCPDYWSECRNMVIEPPPAFIVQCTYQGRPVGYNPIMKNCNQCKCVQLNSTFAEMMCETKDCLVDPEVIDLVNQFSSSHGWTATNYSKFWGRTLEEGIELRLGTLKPQPYVMSMNPVRSMGDPLSLPKHFDAEQKWIGLLSKIQDQGWCGSSWALSTAATASDRFAVFTKGIETVTLSAQNLLSCAVRGQRGCKGGYVDKAWFYVRHRGLVDEACFPYSGKSEKCRVPRYGNLLSAGCRLPNNVERIENYKVGPTSRIGNETDIMYEIYKSGPVQATMLVYQDFFVYAGGIYKHRESSVSRRTGYHSVRIIGWGEEVTDYGVEKYWRVANSWGTDWGENGYFRIARGTNECQIESLVLAVNPDIPQNVINILQG